MSAAVAGLRSVGARDLRIDKGTFDIEFTTDAGEAAAVDVVGPRRPRLYGDDGDRRLLRVTPLANYHQRVGPGRSGRGPLAHDHGWAGSRCNELLVGGRAGAPMALPNPWSAWPLGTFIASWVRGEWALASRLVFQEPGGRLEVSLLERRCFSCQKAALVWSVDVAGTSACSHPYAHLSRIRSLYDDARPEFSQEVRAMVEQTAADEGRLADLSTVAERPSSALGRSYLSFGCPHCDILFGDHYNYRWSNFRIDLLGIVAWVGPCQATIPDTAFAHWCGHESACQVASRVSA